MEFGLSEDQGILQDALSRLLSARSSLQRVRDFCAAKTSRAADVIAALGEYGAYGLTIEERYGGSALTMLDAALASEQLGRFVAPAPFVGSLLAALALSRVGDDGQKQRWLPSIASGAVVAGAAISEVAGARDGAGVDSRDHRLFGRALFVVDFEADIYVVADRLGRLYLLEAGAKGVTRRALPTIDQTRPTGELLLDGAAADLLPQSNAASARALLDAGRVMLAADTLGAAQAMLDQAVAYAKQREQFGRPIATFQAVKHMCAEMAAALEPSRALVWLAAHTLDASRQESSLAACHAKAHLSEVGQQVAKTATEVHGGMGFTDLVGLHYWFKRIGFNRQMLGGPQAVRDDAARLQGLVASTATSV